ncbi:hypothetical protein, partial [Escherichia coli]|uniref:hypothetical protein n=1 Tax=Escherichia coli TaxID=562 RepID=UPI00184C99E5
ALTALPAQAQTADELFDIRKNFSLVGRLVETLAGEYVDPLDAERMLRAGIAGMTATLDPYTVFFDEAATAAGRLEQGRDVGGVG